MNPGRDPPRLEDTNTMKIPRWTVYPALAVIGTLLITAVPKTEQGEKPEGAAKRAREALIERATAGKIEELKVMSKTRTEEIMAPVKYADGQ